MTSERFTAWCYLTGIVLAAFAAGACIVIWAEAYWMRFAIACWVGGQ